ncbi:hypothetical protein [Scleromatobacter humisilvae]|uniref:Uncharacterized protein n=1 Tax=Scleromatobacter humisilvae TaxID=2897159 RepID=A0A9X2C2T4_9BURK|nr:hypothetical protein [Scleromatobacter humisilvae]MCK9686405.1 hypothetical protein [Scleromatobacter humisilvae]
MRATTSALLGGSAVVVGWMAWSALAPADSPPFVATAESIAASGPAAAPPEPPPRFVPPARLATASTLPATTATATAPTRPPALRSGLVLEHGMPTALHALADDGTAAATMAPPAVALPAGARSEDAVVSPSGMVALTHSVATPAPESRAATDPARPAFAERAH